MEIIYPEIALKRPKADPRTVLFAKNRYYMESSTDHIRDFYTNSIPRAYCDKFKNNMCKYTANATTTSSSQNTTSAAVATVQLSAAGLSTRSSSSSLLTALRTCNLVNFTKSCHFQNSFNNYALNNKTQKTSE